LFNGHLSESILFTYNARATNGQLCLQASPNDTTAYFELAAHASMVEVGAVNCTCACVCVEHACFCYEQFLY